MKKLLKKLFGFSLTLALATSSALIVFANQVQIETEQDIYYNILQSLGDEYGLEVGFEAPYGFNKLQSGDGINKEQLSPEEFEGFVREELEQLVEHNQMVIDKYEEDGSTIKDAEWIKIDTSDNITSQFIRAVKSYFSDKKYDGINVTLKGIVSDDTGYWTFKQIDDSTAGWTKLTSLYKATSYTYKYIDARRTCAVTYDGYVYYSIGNFFVYDIKEYAEFYAGSK